MKPEFDEEDFVDPELDNYISQIKVSVNAKEIKWLREGMILLKQIRPSTALKHLAEYGAMKMYQDRKMIHFLNDNQRLNDKKGILDISREVEIGRASCMERV